MNQVNCADCVNSYDGADSVLRCRLNGKPAAAACDKFEREPGADASERDPARVWYCDSIGRGD